MSDSGNEKIEKKDEDTESMQTVTTTNTTPDTFEVLPLVGQDVVDGQGTQHVDTIPA